MSSVPVQARGRATRDAVVAAARELFGGQGYDATSLEGILGRSGVKRGALYHHFESKRAVFDAVIDQVLSEVSAAMEEAYDPEDDPVPCIRDGCHAWLAYASTPPIQRLVLLDAPVVLGRDRWRELDEQYFSSFLARDLARSGAPGGGASVDPSLLAGLIMAGVNELAQRVAADPDPAVALDRARVAVDLLVDRLVVGPS